MKPSTRFHAAVLAGCAFPVSMAFGQLTGTSRPDDVPVTTSDQLPRQPVIYTQSSGRSATVSVSLPASAPTVPQQPGEPAFVLVGATPDVIGNRPAPFDPDAHVVGDGAAPLTRRPAAAVAAQMGDGIVLRVAGPSNGLPVGTVVKTRLLTSLSTRGTIEGAEWQAELLEPLVRDGRVLIPAGAMVRGRVTGVHGGRRISGEASLHLQPFAVTMPDGTQLGMHAQVIDTNLFHTTKVDEEGTILRRDHTKEDAGILALTAGSGAAAGAIIAGPPGALVGAGVGAGVSTAIWLKQDRQAELPRNTQVTFELTVPMILGGA